MSKETETSIIISLVAILISLIALVLVIDRPSVEVCSPDACYKNGYVINQNGEYTTPLK